MGDQFAGGPLALRSTDSMPLPEVPLAMLDLDRVAAHIRRAVDRGRYQGDLDPMAYLRVRRCIAEHSEGWSPTPAGVLCFGYRPQDIFTRATVDLAHYFGVAPLSYEVLHLERDIGGTIFDQIERIETYLWANTHHGMTVVDSMQRVELHEYPRIVLRELTVNALAHRDYTNIMSATRVQLFRNTIEWVNPGGLPPGMTVQNLLVGQAARNPSILSILFESGYVEAIGQGLDTVVAVLAHEGMAPPLFEDDGSFFRVVVAGRPPETFTRGDAYTQLTDRQRTIVGILRAAGAPLSSRGIAERLGDQATQRSIQRDLKILVEAGLLDTIGESVAVRYRLRDASPPQLV